MALNVRPLHVVQQQQLLGLQQIRQLLAGPQVELPVAESLDTERHA